MSEEHLSASGNAAPDLIALYEAHAKRNGITVPMLRVLEAIGQRPGSTQKALCALLQMSKQRVNLLVRALAQKTLLVQSRSETDGRSRSLRLTEQGEAAVAAFFEERSAAGNGDEPHEAHTHVLEDGTVVTHTHGGAHGHTHSHQHTKAVLDRLARSIGHLEKVRQMVEAGADCSEVLIQLSAVKAAINSTGKIILKDHIEHCLVDAIEHGDHQTVEELNRAIDQFIK